MAWRPRARYLLRNGIDYINYQEYERALKYLREAESRQKELSSSERLALKQAIEKAQRGWREAVGSRTPYALSQRGRHPGGFSPAKPNTQLAAIPSIPSTAPAQAKESLARTANREGDDQGEPIRLTGGEIASPAPSPSPSTASATATPVPSTATASSDVPQPLPITTDPPGQLPDMNKLPVTTTVPKSIPDYLTKIADPPPQLPADASTPTVIPAAVPKPDAAAVPKPDAATLAAPADLPAPLMTGTNADAVAADQKALPTEAAATGAMAATPTPLPLPSSAPGTKHSHACASGFRSASGNSCRHHPGTAWRPWGQVHRQRR